MEVDELGLFLFGPLLLVDSPTEVVVVAFPALLAIPGWDAELFLHDAGDLTPLADLPNFKQLLENLIILTQKKQYLLLPDLAFRHCS